MLLNMSLRTRFIKIRKLIRLHQFVPFGLSAVNELGFSDFTLLMVGINNLKSEFLYCKVAGRNDNDTFAIGAFWPGFP